MAFLSKKLSQKLLQMKEKRRNETKYKNCSEVLKVLILQAFQHLIKPDKTYSYLAFSNVNLFTMSANLHKYWKMLILCGAAGLCYIVFNGTKTV